METTHLSPLEPLARAYARAVAGRPKDDGLFGPKSLVWRVNRDRSFPLAGMRSLMIQALHPLAMAGVAQHSNWRLDPFGRLAATSGYVLTTTYADTESALAAANSSLQRRGPSVAAVGARGDGRLHRHRGRAIWTPP